MQDHFDRPLSESATIAAMAEHDAQRFMKQTIRNRQLSPLVVRLNHDVLDGDESASRMARKALRRLGFI